MINIDFLSNYRVIISNDKTYGEVTITFRNEEEEKEFVKEITKELLKNEE